MRRISLWVSILPDAKLINLDSCKQFAISRNSEKWYSGQNWCTIDVVNQMEKTFQFQIQSNFCMFQFQLQLSQTELSIGHNVIDLECWTFKLVVIENDNQVYQGLQSSVNVFIHRVVSMVNDYVNKDDSPTKPILKLILLLPLFASRGRRKM